MERKNVLLEKKKHLREDAAKCAKLPDLFRHSGVLTGAENIRVVAQARDRARLQQVDMQVNMHCLLQRHGATSSQPHKRSDFTHINGD